MNHNGTRSPEEIQSEIERTRLDIDDTLSEIESRLSPGELVDHGLDYLRSSGAREYVSKLGEQAKQNPIPLALMGVSLAWLMMSSGRSPGGDTASWPYPSGQRITERASEAASGMKESMKGTLSQTSRKLSDTAQKISDSAQAAGDTARQQVRRAQDTYRYMVNEQPLALGAVGLAIGAVLAAFMPRTQKEDELMGEASDRMKEKAQEAAQPVAEKVKQTAQSVKDAVKTGSSGIESTASRFVPPRQG